MTSTSAERSTTAPAPVSERPAYGLLAGLALGLLPAELDQSVFATALPTVVTELGGLAGLALINTSYVLAGAVAMLLVGPLGDRFGRRPVFVWATVAFLAGSVLGGVGTDAAGTGLGTGRPGPWRRRVAGADPGDRRRPGSAASARLVPRCRRRHLRRGSCHRTGARRLACRVRLVALGVLAQRAARRTRSARGDALAAGQPATVFRSPHSIATAATEPAAPPRRWAAGRGQRATRRRGVRCGQLLPTFLQLAAGQTAVRAGLTMLSLVAGLGLATLASAQWLRRTGRAYGLPIIGALLVALALSLCATLTPGSPLPTMIGYFFLLGTGTGLAWEVLVVVVQEAAPTSTSSAAPRLERVQP